MEWAQAKLAGGAPANAAHSQGKIGNRIVHRKGRKQGKVFRRKKNRRFGAAIN
jgi:hypothetical protein